MFRTKTTYTSSVQHVANDDHDNNDTNNDETMFLSSPDMQTAAVSIWPGSVLAENIFRCCRGYSRNVWIRAEHDPEDTTQWMRATHDPEDTTQWMRAEHDPEDTTQWIRAEHDPEDTTQ